MLHVRTAIIDDADDVAQAHVQGWRVGYRGLFPDEYLDAPEFERHRVERWRLWTWQEFASSELFVAVLDDRVVGFSHLGPERQQPTCDQSGTAEIVAAEGPVGEVYGFYLHPDAWGSGAAAALMQRSVERLAELQYTDAVLWVLRDNSRARAFYEKVGWRSTGKEIMWDGPFSAPHPPDPVPEVQYATSLSHLL
jgi:GNAT superfamily N-acetyltransferase